MSRRFRASDGIVAVWEGETDRLPFDDPYGNLTRVKFHSSIPYVKIIDVRTFTLSIPAITSATPDRAQSYTLGAHGQTGQPFVIGVITVNGVAVAFTGSVPVHQAGGSFDSFDPYGRWLALGADATNLYVHEYAVQGGNANIGVYNGRPAQSFSITAYITDILL